MNRISISIKKTNSFKQKKTGRCGRKRITTSRDDRQIRDICLNNRKKSLSFIQNESQKIGIFASKRTIQRRLQEKNLTGRRPVRKPRPTVAMIKKRLMWAKKHKTMTVQDWSKVIFVFQIINSI